MPLSEQKYQHNGTFLRNISEIPVSKSLLKHAKFTVYPKFTTVNCHKICTPNPRKAIKICLKIFRRKTRAKKTRRTP